MFEITVLSMDLASHIALRSYSAARIWAEKVGLFDKSKVFVGGVFLPLRHDQCAVVQCAHKRLDGLYKCAHRQHVAASINDLVASVLVRMGAHYDRHLLDVRLDRGE
jgi:hypothetical protein